MPKIAIDYSKTIIYKIVCNDVNIKDLYVGHTTNFTKRKNGHKSNCNNINSKLHNYYVYQFIRNNGNWDNFSMIEVEKYFCNDKLEAKKRERYWIEMLNANLNKVIPSRTFKEYYEDNKPKITEYNKEYYDNNKSNLLEQHKIYYENNKIKLLEQKQNYYEDNKSKILEQRKIYRENNRSNISEKGKIRTICIVCNCNIRKDCIRNHNRSIKHQKNLLMNQQENDNS
jgi:hypothetical protein